MLARLIKKGKIKVRGGFEKTPDGFIRIGEKGVKTKRLHTHGNGDELGHGLREKEEVRRVNRNEVPKHCFGREVTNASTIPVKNLKHWQGVMKKGQKISWF